MNTNEKRMRGRPKGSNSFSSVTLAELNARFSQDQVIPVGRIFLEKGSSVNTVQPSPQPEGPKVEMTLSE